MKNSFRKTHLRHQSFTAKHQHRKLHALQHHDYLLSLQKNNSLFPRYDIFSEKNHNNLIVHVKENSRQQLKPKKTSFLVTKLQQKIQTSQKIVTKARQTQSKFFNRSETSRSQQLNSGLILPTNGPITHQQRGVKQVRNMVIYEQQEDKGLSMQKKLRMLYLGPRFERSRASQVAGKHNNSYF